MKTNILTNVESPVLSARHSLVSKIENAILKGEFAMGVLVDIEGAFDCAAFQKLCDAAKEHGALHRTLEELLGELNLVFAISSDSRIPIYLFGKGYDVILKRIENWDESEECLSGYTDE